MLDQHVQTELLGNQRKICKSEEHFARFAAQPLNRMKSSHCPSRENTCIANHLVQLCFIQLSQPGRSGSPRPVVNR